MGEEEGKGERGRWSKERSGERWGRRIVGKSNRFLAALELFGGVFMPRRYVIMSLWAPPAYVAVVNGENKFGFSWSCLDQWPRLS